MKIAIVKLSALGDIIHAMVVLQFIKKHNQEIVVDWVVEESYKELLEFNPDINNVYVVNIKKAKKKKSLYLLLKELRKVRQFDHYDLVIDMQGILKSAMVTRLISSDQTLGFDHSSTRESLAALFYKKTFKFPYDENVIERNLTLIQFALKMKIHKEEISNKESFLYSTKKYIFNYISKEKNNILLVPGASYKSKRYPVEKLADIANKLDANFLVAWGSNKEKELANEINTLSPKIKVLEKLTLDSLISLISQVNLVIGSDTGPTHMAWALNIPSITLYGPTPGYRNSYRTEINRVIESDSEVNPFKINKNDFSIKNIHVTDIVKISNELLDCKKKIN